MLVIAVIIILLIFLSKSKTFVPENKIVDSSLFEVPRYDELNSCQMDCSFGNSIFHEECVGFNGCEDSLFLRNKSYCEKDSDCIVDFGCCAEDCKDNCSSVNFCSVSNNKFIEAHAFSCVENIICKKRLSCIGSFQTACLNKICRIIS